jgi:hypothetical protein
MMTLLSVYSDTEAVLAKRSELAIPWCWSSK